MLIATSMTGEPLTTPLSSASSMPFLQAGMYSFGMLPPTTLFSMVMPLPRSLRHHVEDDVAVLTATARLLDELAFAFARSW